MDSGTLVNFRYAMFDDNDCQEHPKLLEMIKAFETTKSLLSNDKQKEFNKSVVNVVAARFKYINNIVLLKALRDINYMLLIQPMEPRMGFVKDTLKINLHEALSFMEMKRSLKCLQIDSLGSSKCESNLLHVEEKHCLRPQWTDSDRNNLKQLIQNWLYEHANDLAKFCSGLLSLDQHNSTNKTDDTDPITSLIAVNEETKYMFEDLKLKKSNLRKSQSKLQFLTRECKENLNRMHDKLNGLARMQLEETEDVTKIDYIQSRSDQLANEQTLFQLQMFRDVYTQEIVAANENINLKLDDHVQHLQYQIIKAKYRLSEYETLGPQFVYLAQEHAALLDEMEIKRGILQSWDERK